MRSGGKTEDANSASSVIEEVEFTKWQKIILIVEGETNTTIVVYIILNRWTKRDFCVRWRLGAQLQALGYFTVCPAWLEAKLPRPFLLQWRYLIIEIKRKPRPPHPVRLRMSVVRDHLSHIRGRSSRWRLSYAEWFRPTMDHNSVDSLETKI